MLVRISVIRRFLKLVLGWTQHGSSENLSCARVEWNFSFDFLDWHGWACEVSPPISSIIRGLCVLNGHPCSQPPLLQLDRRFNSILLELVQWSYLRYLWSLRLLLLPLGFLWPISRLRIRLGFLEWCQLLWEVGLQIWTTFYPALLFQDWLRASAARIAWLSWLLISICKGLHFVIRPCRGHQVNVDVSKLSYGYNTNGISLLVSAHDLLSDADIEIRHLIDVWWVWKAGPLTVTLSDLQLLLLQLGSVL